jgi:hypothetical protein
VYAVNYWKRRSMHTESPMHGFLLFFLLYNDMSRVHVGFS